MKSFLVAVVAAYLIAAIHSILAFVNKRAALQRVAEWSLAAGFVVHIITLLEDWTLDGHYPLFNLKETLSFLAWALVAVYGVVLYRYRAQAIGVFMMPLISILSCAALVIQTGPNDAPAAFSATWLFPVHTTLLIFAYAAFFVVFIASVMYLLQERELRDTGKARRPQARACDTRSHPHGGSCRHRRRCGEDAQSLHHLARPPRR